ncbi:hypothetical protein Asi03nite_01390 [Actinoplanes siamensis]|uniref:Uncharacterized protein n=1 Tax=Actinoplanes siamensis TaxID=1223317 RepID=A0A919K7X1_9ACTN|nr:hypothetical protein Asi03nite_01390 [Actinoplanes siamensis]
MAGLPCEIRGSAALAAVAATSVYAASAAATAAAMRGRFRMGDEPFQPQRTGGVRRKRSLAATVNGVLIRVNAPKPLPATFMHVKGSPWAKFR